MLTDTEWLFPKHDFNVLHPHNGIIWNGILMELLFGLKKQCSTDTHCSADTCCNIVEL